MAQNLTHCETETQEVEITETFPRYHWWVHQPYWPEELQRVEEGKIYISEECRAQVEAGAGILDVNAGVPGVDEPALIVQLIKVSGNWLRFPSALHGKSEGFGGCLRL